MMVIPGAYLELLVVLKFCTEPWKLVLQFPYAVASQAGHALDKLVPAELAHRRCIEVPAEHQHDLVLWIDLLTMSRRFLSV